MEMSAKGAEGATVATVEVAAAATAAATTIRDRRVRLGDIIRHKSRVQGFGGLGLFLIYAVVVGLVPILLTLPGESEQRTAVNMKMAAYDDSSSMADVSTLQAGAAYQADLMEYLIEDSIENEYPNEAVIIATNVIKYASLQFAITKWPGKDGKVSDYKYLSDILEADKPPYNDTLKHEYGVSCQKLDTPLYSVGRQNKGEKMTYDIKLVCILEVIHEPFNRTESYNRLQYWKHIVLPNADPAMAFAGGGNQLVMLTQHRNIPYAGSQHLLWFSLDRQNLVSNPFRNQSLYSANGRDILRTFVEIVWVVLSCLYTFYEYQDYRRTTAAYYGQVGTYMSKFWNCYDCLSQFVTMFSIIVHYFGVLPIVEPIYAKGGWPTNVENHSSPAFATFALQTDITTMILSFMMIGGRMFKYIRYHPGTAVYIDTFAQTYKSIADFFVWFFTILLWLTVSFYLLFTLFGTNPRFSTFLNSINVMALLTFGYAGYDTIYNDGIGFGSGYFWPTVFFWLFVFLTVMFAQNIILAIICSAYDAAQEKNDDTEGFIRYCMKRSAFALKRLMKHPSTTNFESQMQSVDAGDVAEINRIAELVSRRDDSFNYLPGTVQDVEEGIWLGLSYTVLFDDGETETGISPSLLRFLANSLDERKLPRKGDRVEVRGGSSSGRLKEYSQQACLNNPVVDLVQEYFQSSLRVSPRLDFWLWDHGTVIKTAEEKVRKTLKPSENLFSSQRPNEIFDYDFTYEQFKSLLSEVVKCGPLISAIGIPKPSEGTVHEVARNLFIAFSYSVDESTPANSITSYNTNEEGVYDVTNPLRNGHGSSGSGMVEQPSLSTTAAASFSRVRNNATSKKRRYMPGGGAKSQRAAMADMDASIVEMRYEMRAQAEAQAEMLRAMAAQISSLVDTIAEKSS